MFDIAPALKDGLASTIADPAPVQAVSPGQTAAQGFQGGGSSIPYQAELEQSFGRDLSGVRAHTDENANAASAGLGAHAYAMGNDIAFATSNPSKDLVAHEVTHVLQQEGGGGASGGGPQMKADTSAGIDTSGEEEAEKVQAAVKEGRPALSALEGGVVKGGGPQLKKGKGIARSAHGPHYAAGFTFSPEAFEAIGEYHIWKGGAHWPIPAVPGLNAVVEPEVRAIGMGGANWAHKALEAKLNVMGSVLIGLSYGVPHMAEIYGGLEGRAEGGFTYKKMIGGGAHATPAANAEEHHETPAAAATTHADPHAAGAQQGGEHAAGHAKSWSLDGAIKLSSLFRVGVKLGEGILDLGFDFGHCEIGTLTGLSWKDGHFDAAAIGWEWGPKPKEFFAAVKVGIDKVAALLKMGREAFDNTMNAAKRNLQGMFNAGQQAAEWISSW